MAEEQRPSGFRRRALKLVLLLALGVAGGVALFAPAWPCATCDRTGRATLSPRTQRDCSVCGGRGRVSFSRYLDQRGGALWERDPLR